MTQQQIAKSIKWFLVSNDLHFHETVEGVIQVDVPFSKINYQILVMDGAFIIYGNYLRKLSPDRVMGSLELMVAGLNSPLENGNFYLRDGNYLSYKVFTDVGSSFDYGILDNAFQTIVDCFTRHFSTICLVEDDE